MSSMAAQTIPYITEDEYLQAEREAECKSEYRDGQVYAMAGGRPRHHQITSNTMRRLGNALDGSSCQVFPSALRVYIPASKQYTYPDVSVVCGEPVFFRTDNLVNPILLVEVLSKSTRQHDRTTKFLEYKSIPSLQQYVGIDPDPPSISVFTKTDQNEWTMKTVTEGLVQFARISAEIPFEQVFAGADSLPG